MRKLLSCLMLLFTLSLSAQVSPILYYDFDQANPLSPRVGTGNITATNYEIVTGAVGAGAFAQQYQDSIAYLGSQGAVVTPIGALSVQLLIKPGYFFQNNRKSILFTLGNMTTNFYTANASNGNFTINFTTRNAGTVTNMEYNLDGVNRAALQWFLDSAWHHLVFVHNAVAGVKQIYVDGQLVMSGSCPTGTIDLAANQRLVLNNNTAYDQYYGAWDEVAVYTSALVPRQIYQNYVDFQAGNHYTTALAATVPPPTPLTAGLDSLDFPIGYVLGSTNSSSADYTAIEQLNRYTNPHYPFQHTLRRNFSWNDPQYYGGHLQSDVTNPRVVSAAILKRLYEKYNYMLTAAWNITAGRINEYGDTNTWVGKWVKLANDNPTWERAVTSFWNQNPNALVLSQSLPNNYYLRRGDGTFVLNSLGQKILSPAAPNPGLLNNDGQLNKTNLTLLLAALSPARIDFMNDNDEVFALTDTNLLALDPAVTAEATSLGMYMSEYFSYKQTLLTKVYRDTMMLPYPAATFSLYNISGWDGSLGRSYYYPKYAQRRTINSAIGGRRYSTMDFYPRYHKVWRRWQGAWHGWEPFDEAREVETTFGDKIFSPFVAPGWNINEEQNQRPGRWLGELKCIGVMGVDFYYAGFFNTGNPTVTNPPANPRGYAWQSAMPPYSQAILARVDTIIKTGLKVADVRSDPTRTDTGYATWAGDPRIWCVVRQDSLHNNRYVITATIQPNSAQMGQVPDSWAGKIRIENVYVRFEVRPQGSTYYYVSDSAKFIQLDGWHERIHPDRWTTDITLQAEVADTSTLGNWHNFYSAVTYTDSLNDYRAATSALTGVNPTERFGYGVYPRETGYYKGFVRARSTAGTLEQYKYVYTHDGGADSVTVTLDADPTWKWYALGDSMQFTGDQSYRSIVQLLTSGAEIDRIIYTMNLDTILLPQGGNACIPASINLTYTTPFCTNTTVAATGDSIASYVWSTGATTSSIVVSSTQTVTVIITDSLGCNGDTSVRVVKMNCDTTCIPVTMLRSRTRFKYSIQMVWNPTTVNAYAYQAMVVDVAEGDTTLTPMSTKISSMRVTGLRPGRVYHIAMRTYCQIGLSFRYSDWTLPVKVSTLP